MPLPVDLTVLHQDDDLIVVDKPAGLLVHPSALDAHERDTALARLRRQLGAAAPRGLAPAHRLDKGTSGLLVFACHADAARALGATFEAGQVHKRYLALVRGWPPERARIDHPLARDPERASQGQVHLPAQTDLRRLGRVEWPYASDRRFSGSRQALIEAQPLQGRRHQIRRHLKHLGHPLLGDATHGKGPLNRTHAAWLGIERLWLHALALELPHPRDGRPMHWLALPGPEWLALARHAPWQEWPDTWPPRPAAGA